MSKEGWILVIIWIIGAVSAYPRNKKWAIKEMEISEWTNEEMIWSVFICLFMWWMVWFFFIIQKISDWEWLSKKSKF